MTKKHALDLLLIFVASLTGAYMHFQDPNWGMTLVLFLVLLTTLVLRWIGQWTLPRLMPLCTLFIFLWWFGLFALIAIATRIGFAFSLWLPGVFAGQGSAYPLPDDERTAVTTLIVGAISTFLGALFYDDAKDPKSRLWPAQVFKSAFWAGFQSDDRITGQKTPDLYSAIYAEEVNDRIKGWRFLAAMRRACLVWPLYRRLL
ncbi:hypothetical protein [Ruegeria hyattellae]|uniref:hypothetical protein n=1 Tax=Ruegeria hyattellae TaxID=3233337 RepID=UPI00355BA3A3